MTLSYRYTIIAIVGLLLTMNSARAGVVIDFDDETTVVNVGQVFDVRIVMTTDEPILGWGLDLNIADDSVASLTEPLEIGPLWDQFFSPDGDDLGGLAFPDPIGPGDDYLLATFTFTAHEIGETELTLSITPGDASEGFANNNGGFAAPTLNTGLIVVVPAPGAAALLLLGFAAPQRRRRR